jgi:hypothetical protein
VKRLLAGIYGEKNFESCEIAIFILARRRFNTIIAAFNVFTRDVFKVESFECLINIERLVI